MTTLFCIRPKGFNIGNEVIFIGLQGFIRKAFNGFVNLISLPATARYESSAKSGLTAKTIYEMNQYGEGVIVGGGNLYENGELDVDLNALKALEIPLMLFSLSRGRIYNRDLQLVNRTDAMPEGIIKALNDKASFSLARDQATLSYLHSIGAAKAEVGGCPTAFLDEILPAPTAPAGGNRETVLVSLRHPSLMNIPPALQASVYSDIPAIVELLRAEGYRDIKLLCHDHRDISLAITFKGLEYVYTEDAMSYLDMLRNCALNVSYRLHASLPCISFGTPTIQINYDERAISLMETLGLGSWGINMCNEIDVIQAVREHFRRLPELKALVNSAREGWAVLHQTMDRAFKGFAAKIWKERSK
jgi:polysaccharide pyruvyl transferase WcaK-like protein